MTETGNRPRRRNAPFNPETILQAFGTNSDYREISELLVGKSQPPDWLIGLVEEWTIGIRLDRAVADRQPRRKEMKRRLECVVNAAEILRAKLQDTAVMEMIDPQIHSSNRYDKIGADLNELAGRADQALKGMLNEKGKLSAGAGKALPEEAVAPETLCVLLIGECWNHLRKEQLKPRSQEAADVAIRWWQVVGGPDEPWGDQRARWRPYFAKAAYSACDELRAEIRQTLKNAEHHARVLHAG